MTLYKRLSFGFIGESVMGLMLVKEGAYTSWNLCCGFKDREGAHQVVRNAKY